MFKWLARRQATADLQRVASMSSRQRAELLLQAAIAWEALVSIFGFIRANPVAGLCLDSQAPWKVSKARIQAAAENAPHAQLDALSIWQITARASQKGADPQMLAAAVGIWNCLRDARHDDEHVLTEPARKLASQVYETLVDWQKA